MQPKRFRMPASLLIHTILQNAVPKILKCQGWAPHGKIGVLDSRSGYELRGRLANSGTGEEAQLSSARYYLDDWGNERLMIAIAVDGQRREFGARIITNVDVDICDQHWSAMTSDGTAPPQNTDELNTTKQRQ